MDRRGAMELRVQCILSTVTASISWWVTWNVSIVRYSCYILIKFFVYIRVWSCYSHNSAVGRRVQLEYLVLVSLHCGVSSSRDSLDSKFHFSSLATATPRPQWRRFGASCRLCFLVLAATPCRILLYIGILNYELPAARRRGRNRASAGCRYVTRNKQRRSHIVMHKQIDHVLANYSLLL